MSDNLQQDALNALADAALGNDSPEKAFITGYRMGREQPIEITDDMVKRAAKSFAESMFEQPIFAISQPVVVKFSYACKALEAALNGGKE